MTLRQGELSDGGEARARPDAAHGECDERV